MQRYFLEVAYKGTHYSGFQVQQNAVTIQSKVEYAMQVLFKNKYPLACSSRTDAGVHARQNFFHVDIDVPAFERKMYNLNALLPHDIVLKSIVPVAPDAHARFSATHRQYKYYITKQKNPFLTETAWFYPYKLQVDLLQAAADILLNQTDFTSFSKRHTQVKTFFCQIDTAQWTEHEDCLVFTVKANRFLRGMVRALVGTMLLVGRGSIDMNRFIEIIEQKDCTQANFSTPATGLFLEQVIYPFPLG